MSAADLKAAFQRERPILFSGAMVRAILEGRKTQTRRVWKQRFHPEARLLRMETVESMPAREAGEYLTKVSVCPYGIAGDRLYVRETWVLNDVRYDRGPIPKERPADLEEILYRADGEWHEQFEQLDGDPSPWKPGIHMPRWASRIDLEVLSVRVERLQEISEADARAEGLAPDEPHGWWQVAQRGKDGSVVLREGGDANAEPPPWMEDGTELAAPSRHYPRVLPALHHFEVGWNSINGKCAPWASNPFVWAISFKRIR